MLGIAGTVQDEAEDYARRMRARYECSAPAHELDKIAAHLGYRVRWCTLAELAGPEGASLNKLILVARGSTPARDLWTLAHEVTHGELGEPHDADDRELEDRVDACVSAWLLPRTHFLDRVYVKGLHLGVLARDFGTSLEATARRFLGVTPCAFSMQSQAKPPRIWSSSGGHSQRFRVRDLVVRAHERGEHTTPTRDGDWIVGTWSTPGRSCTYALAVPHHLVCPF